MKHESRGISPIISFFEKTILSRQPSSRLLWNDYQDPVSLKRGGVKSDLIQTKQGVPAKIKENLFLTPFDVMFECNTEIPDCIGIGKFVSRGYITVVQYG